MKSKIYNHTLAVYDAMYKASKEEVVAGNKVVRIFRGFTTHILRSLDIPPTYYTPIKRKLEFLGCIEILESGARNIPSVIVLLGHPKDIEWPARMPREKSGLTKSPAFDMLLQRLDNIDKRLGGINLADALRNMESRLASVEAHLGLNQGDAPEG